MPSTGLIRVGIVGLGANTRLRHLPGLRACPGVEIAGVCNRTAESTAAAARQFDSPKTYPRWQDLVADPQLDAVVIGTWPYLHAPVTLAALDAGKHVLTEARMATSAAEARTMLAAARRRPDLVTQIVPSPLGLRVDRTVKRLIDGGWLGRLQEVVALATSGMYADPRAPRHWRQAAEYSGCNMLALGILHETLLRWIPQPERVFAASQIFTTERLDPDTSRPASVETPDCVHLLAAWPDGARGLYHLSGVAPHGPPPQIHLYGSEGTLKIPLEPDERLLAARRGDAALTEVPIPPEEAGGWRVEEDFIAAIRGEGRIEFTDFAAGVRYMEFTEAAAHSAKTRTEVAIPGDAA